MNRGLGFWLDYWLFLNSDDAHPLWASRPLGLKRLAQDCLQCTDHSDRALRAALAVELAVAAPLSHRIAAIPRPPADAPDPHSNWSRSWIDWFELVVASPKREIVESFVRGLATAISLNDYRVVAFLARRLSAEVSSSENYQRALYAPVDQSFAIEEQFANPDFDALHFSESLLSIISPEDTRQYHVTVPFARTQASRRAIKAFESYYKFVIDTEADGKSFLSGVEFKIEAGTHHDASGVAIDKARVLLQNLRLKANVHTHIWGTLVVTEEESGITLRPSPPQPFWDRASGSPKAPRLPPHFSGLLRRLEASERTRWTASTWHIAQAVADWAEDCHNAASKVWQALETFSPAGGKALSRVHALIPNFIHTSIFDLGESLSADIASQRHYVREIGLNSNWRARLPEERPVDWLEEVYVWGSPSHYTKWEQPWVPDVICNYDVGILNEINGSILRDAPPKWMPDRLSRDLTLLYALRNKVVHTGEPRLSRSMASYLARFGIEFLLTLMRRRDSELPLPDEAVEGDDG